MAVQVSCNLQLGGDVKVQFFKDKEASATLLYFCFHSAFLENGPPPPPLPSRAPFLCPPSPWT